MQPNRDVVVSIRCSMYSGSVSVRCGSKIIVHTDFKITVFDWPMKSKTIQSTYELILLNQNGRAVKMHPQHASIINRVNRGIDEILFVVQMIKVL